MLNDAHAEDIAARLDALRVTLADLLATTATGGMISTAGGHAADAHDKTAPVAIDTDHG